jgi:hypothetical protein
MVLENKALRHHDRGARRDRWPCAWQPNPVRGNELGERVASATPQRRWAGRTY